jgi:hypothetical protein
VLCSSGAHVTGAMKMNIRSKDTVLTATLLGSKAARDFASLLPLKLTMQDIATTGRPSRAPASLFSASWTVESRSSTTPARHW